MAEARFEGIINPNMSHLCARAKVHLSIFVSIVNKGAK